MDDAGNILIRRYAKSNVYVKSTSLNANDETAIGAEILKLPNNALESEKIVKVNNNKKKQNKSMQIFVMQRFAADKGLSRLLYKLYGDDHLLFYKIIIQFRSLVTVIRYEKVSIKCQP